MDVSFGLLLAAVCFTFLVISDAYGSIPIYILGLYPMSGGWPGGQGLLPATQLAFLHINNNETFLKDYELILLDKDTQVGQKSFRCSSHNFFLCTPPNFLWSHDAVTGKWQCGDYLLVALLTGYKAMSLSHLRGTTLWQLHRHSVSHHIDTVQYSDCWSSHHVVTEQRMVTAGKGLVLRSSIMNKNLKLKRNLKSENHKDLNSPNTSISTYFKSALSVMIKTKQNKKAALIHVLWSC